MAKTKADTKPKAAPAFDPNGPQTKPVLVTTEHRGVFQGDLESYDATTRTAIIRQARCVIRWAGIRGFVALAATGPTSSCRISAAGPRMTLEKVTSVTECTPEAVAAFQKEPW
jgi:hypothetical protein